MLKSKITSYYERHNLTRFCQGDILREFSFYLVGRNNAQVKVNFDYVILISQDCDIEHAYSFIESDIPERKEIKDFNQYLPNLLFLPAFPAEYLRAGNYLENLFNIKATPINSDRWKKAKQNLEERYHFLEADPNYQMPELAIDFKIYYSMSTGYFFDKFKSSYLATLNELFRESLVRRFVNYTSRIALPELPVLHQ